MGKFYSMADGDTLAIRDKVVAEHFPELKEVGLAISVQFVYAARDKHTGEPKGPALRLHGNPAAALIKINNLADRVEGKGDVTIKIDGDLWKDFTDRRKESIFHHECQHVVVQRDEDGAATLDDAMRPVVKLREHDVVVGAFMKTTEVYGYDSLEADMWRKAEAKFKQGLLPWG